MPLEDKCLKPEYGNIFLVQNRDFWRACPYDYDCKRDLVLTYDFGLVKEISDSGGMASYFDHLVDSVVMEKYNYETYSFFSKWFQDKDGKDAFMYRGIPLGNSFRLEIWNEITHCVRILMSLLFIKKLRFDSICVGTQDAYTHDLMAFLMLPARKWEVGGLKKGSEYCFPIFRWMEENVHPEFKNFKQILKSFIFFTLDILFMAKDAVMSGPKNKDFVFVSRYFSTEKIIEKLKTDASIQVITPSYRWDKGRIKERRVPVFGGGPGYKKKAAALLKEFEHKKHVRWFIENIEISEFLYKIILVRVARILPVCLKTVDSILGFFSSRKLKIMVTVSNLGILNSLFLNYCNKNRIPSYLVINGFLGNSYLDEGKFATFINSYSESIKNNYFKGMERIVCLGDPRMDDYADSRSRRMINRINPKIIIGAAGFNLIDLNAYVGFEFDFLNDILTVCRELLISGKKMEIVLKVRINGYVDQYRDFLNEYFSDIPVSLCDNLPFRQVIRDADFYISTYSQTLFEASSLGIPVVYYKKDNEILHPPFDGKSELVTASSPSDLKEKISGFYGNKPIFEPFGRKEVMEKYIGFLDGRNLERNMDFIRSVMDGPTGQEKRG